MPATLLPLAVAAPLLLAAALAPLSPIAPRRLADACATLCALFVALLCGALAVETLHVPVHYWFGGWTPSHGVALGIEFAVDPIGAGLAAFVALLVALAFAFSWWYFDSAGTHFHVLMLIFLAAMAGFALTGDLFNLFVFFELMSVAAFALTGYKIEEEESIEGAINFAITNSLGAFLVLIGIGLLYGRTGALNLAQIGAGVAHARPDGLLVAAFVLLLTGFFVKGAVVPFHFWLDDAHAVAPTPLCVLFSGVMVQLALYAVARIFWEIFAAPFSSHEAPIRLLLVVMGTITALTGGIMAFNQHHIKRMLAFSTISHSGLFICAIATFSALGIAAGAVFVAAHGLLKAALFMGSGVLLQRTGSVDAVKLHGRCTHLTPLALLFVIGGFALAGLPPFGIAAGKTMLETAVRDAGLAWLAIVFAVASALDGAAVLRVAGSVFFGLGHMSDDRRSSTAGNEKKETSESRNDTLPTMILTAYAALVLCLAAGTVPQFAGWAERAGAIFLHGARAPFVPTLALHDALLNLAVALGAGLLALAALYLPRYKIFSAPAAALRALHSGAFPDYALWMIAGVAVYGAFLVPIAAFAARGNP